MTLSIEAPNMIRDCLPGPEDCWTKKLEDTHYLIQLAADLNAMEQQDDQEGMDSLWSNFGYRDCMRATHIFKTHGENLPEPQVTVIPGSRIEQDDTTEPGFAQIYYAAQRNLREWKLRHDRHDRRNTEKAPEYLEQLEFPGHMRVGHNHGYSHTLYRCAGFCPTEPQPDSFAGFPTAQMVRDYEDRGEE